MVGGMTGVDKDILPYSLVKGNRCKFENINLIGLKRMKYSNEDINYYKVIMNNLFECKNLEDFKHSLKHENSILIKELINFLNKKNKNRDICRP